MAASYQIKLIDRKELASETFGCYFEKPEGFHFNPGQTLRLTLLNLPETDTEGNTRLFSIASAPIEKTLLIASRTGKTAFKHHLSSLPIGSQVNIRGPFGDFLLHKDTSRPAVFLAGGIGITPFRSILVQAKEEKLTHDFFLFYFNRKPEDAAFLEELKNLQKSDFKFNFFPVMTSAEGHLDGEKFKKYLNAKGLTNYSSPIYYVVGPPAMVNALRDLLKDVPVDSSQIFVEEFEGYGVKVSLI